MSRLSRTDLEAVVAFLGDVAEDDSLEPFSPRLVGGLSELFPGTAIVWAEIDLNRSVTAAGPRPAQVRLNRDAWWDLDQWRAHWNLDPILRTFGADIPRPVTYADCLTRAERRRDAFWNEVVRPAGIRDTLRVSLAAPRGRRQTISFDRFDGEFSERDREVLTILRPHLNRQSTNVRGRPMVEGSAPGAARLTTRQLEVLRLAALGKTNAEIAALLYVSPGTVRKHMDNVFARLEVHSRTAAVAVLFGRQTV